jgi:hypothetical protein
MYDILDPYRFLLTLASSGTRPVLSSGRFTCPAVVTVPPAATFKTWTGMFSAKFFHRPAKIQRVLLAKSPEDESRNFSRLIEDVVVVLEIRQ